MSDTNPNARKKCATLASLIRSQEAEVVNGVHTFGNVVDFQEFLVSIFDNEQTVKMMVRPWKGHEAVTRVTFEDGTIRYCVDRLDLLKVLFTNSEEHQRSFILKLMQTQDFLNVTEEVKTAALLDCETTPAQRRVVKQVQKCRDTMKKLFPEMDFTGFDAFCAQLNV